MPIEKGPRERIDRIPKEPEIENGPQIPIQEHTKLRRKPCQGKIGRVTKFDNFNRPEEARCITQGCGKKALIDWAQINTNKNLA
ncbi:MAG TPA: hypothetical protein VF385_02425, partial [Patescibacteria group bacterium]